MIVGTSWIKLEQVGASWKEQKERKEVLNHNPADWIDIQQIGFGHSVDWIESSRLDSKAETPKLKIKESSRLDGDPGD